MGALQPPPASPPEQGPSVTAGKGRAGWRRKESPWLATAPTPGAHSEDGGELVVPTAPTPGAHSEEGGEPLALHSSHSCVLIMRMEESPWLAPAPTPGAHLQTHPHPSGEQEQGEKSPGLNPGDGDPAGGRASFCPCCAWAGFHLPQTPPARKGYTVPSCINTHRGSKRP